MWCGIHHSLLRFFIDSVQCLYNTINFSKIFQTDACPIAHLWGLNVGCLLWVHTLNYVLPHLVQCCMQHQVMYDCISSAVVRQSGYHGVVEWPVAQRRLCQLCTIHWGWSCQAGVANGKHFIDWLLECLFKILFRLTRQKLSKVWITGLLWGEFTSKWWIALTKRQLWGKCFHVIMSSWNLDTIESSYNMNNSWC